MGLSVLGTEESLLSSGGESEVVLTSREGPDLALFNSVLCFVAETSNNTGFAHEIRDSHRKEFHHPQQVNSRLMTLNNLPVGVVPVEHKAGTV